MDEFDGFDGGLLYGKKKRYNFSNPNAINNSTYSNPFMGAQNSYSDFSTGILTPNKFNESLQTSVNNTSLSTGGASELGGYMSNIYGKQTNTGGEIGKNTNTGKENATKKPGGKGASMATGAAVAAAGVGANMLSGSMEKDAGIQADNIDQEVNQGKMAGASAISGAASGASMGMAFGPWGAAVGGVVGGAAGYYTGSVKGKEMEAERKKLVKNRNLGRMHEGQAKLSNESSKLAQVAQSRYGSASAGGKFYVSEFKFSLSGTKENIKKTTNKVFDINSFKIGGKLNDSHNIIPNGISHEEENTWGTKGQPVVKCKKGSCTKVYEIESDELILTKETTNKIEELAKKDKKKELGDYMLKQILGNTYSYTESFKGINNESIQN